MGRNCKYLPMFTYPMLKNAVGRVDRHPVFAGTSRFLVCLPRVPAEPFPGRHLSRFFSMTGCGLHEITSWNSRKLINVIVMLS